MLEPQIIAKPALSVVGFEAAFIHALSPETTNFKVIGPLWERLLHAVGQVTNRAGHDMFGIIYGRIEAERSHPHELQYIAAVPVNSTAEVPPGMVAYTVPAGTFAVVTHRGPIRNIADTVREIYRVWLPQSAYQHAGIADVELYDHRFHPNREDSEMEYWVSVTPRG